MASSLPSNVHVSSHPCVRVKLSKLRSKGTSPRDVPSLVNEIALLVGTEALAEGLQVRDDGTDQSPLGYEFATQSLSPASLTIVPILRSGLSMVPAISSLLPEPVPIHHLGMYREKTTLQPVEYYNNLPYHAPPSALITPGSASGPAELAIIVDPVVATGQTAEAAIDTLKEWGVKRVIFIGVIASEEGLKKVARHPDVSIWVGGCDKELDERGMIKPGLGDIGDRLYLTIGK
ncbi:PRTase-like protein [Pseudovirgaria hyperparasitica]|uniref:uracil phosphoribosyltransferase n=1 Tax=Pseudovirgaria hyperparasitica TaxID=470096 RepID=A0A6A6WK99_9PEZI|nr:PRTase-like protein [Pseudovirgaria hyperparasitica]KAF2762586.1 PRTase-like protein [Pseudovirgaria hyperparasitica]